MVKELINIDEFWDYAHPQKTHDTLYALLEPSKVASSNYYGEVLSQLARTKSVQGKFGEAQRYLDKLEQICDDELTTSFIRYNLERGRSYNSNNEKLLASRYFVIAFTIAWKLKEDFYKIDAAHMLGISEPPEKQLSWNLLALSLAESSAQKRAKKWLGSLYNNIGWTYHDQGNFQEALKIFSKAYEWREAQKDVKGSLIAKWTIGRCYRSLGKIKDALAMQKSLLNDYDSFKIDSDGYVHEEIGECLVLQKKNKEAAQYFATAYSLLKKDKWLQKNEKERLERLKFLSIKES